MLSRGGLKIYLYLSSFMDINIFFKEITILKVTTVRNGHLKLIANLPPLSLPSILVKLVFFGINTSIMQSLGVFWWHSKNSCYELGHLIRYLKFKVLTKALFGYSFCFLFLKTKNNSNFFTKCNNYLRLTFKKIMVFKNDLK